MEEAKSQENAKLQIALQDMQQEVKETRAMLIKEQEAAKKAAGKARIIREVPVVDTAMMDKLTAENNKLKVKLSWFAVIFIIIFICLHLTLLGRCNGGGIGCHFLTIYSEHRVLTVKVLDEGFILGIVLNIVIYGGTIMGVRLEEVGLKLHFSSFYLL